MLFQITNKTALEWRLDEHLILHVCIRHTPTLLCISWHLKGSFAFKWQYPEQFLRRSYNIHLLTQNSGLLFGTEVVYCPQTNSVLWGSDNQRLFSFSFLFLSFFLFKRKHFVHFGYKSWEFCFSSISVTNCEMLPVLQAMCIHMITDTFKNILFHPQTEGLKSPHIFYTSLPTPPPILIECHSMDKGAPCQHS